MKKFFHDNGLSIVMFGLFFLFAFGQSVTGYMEYNNNEKDHKGQEISYPKYLTTGHFVEAIFENWESEFLQMGSYVLLTVFLFQKGSSESKDPDKPKEGKEDQPDKPEKDSPEPVHRNGLALMIYENSLVIALFALFLMSFILHAVGGHDAYNQDQIEHGGDKVTVLQYMISSRFWFESFQNWQSEFLSVGVLVVLSIFLRQRGSPESKPVAAPHSQTGD